MMNDPEPPAADLYMDVVLEQYRAMRVEVLAALQSQQSSLSFGSATLGILIAGGAQVWTGEDVLAGVVFGLLIPTVSGLVATMFLSEQLRLLRAGFFLATLEEVINGRLREPPPQWEHWLAFGCPSKKDVERVQRWAILAVFALVAVGSAVAGFVRTWRTSDDYGLPLGGFALVLLLSLTAAIGFQVDALRKLKRDKASFLGSSPNEVGSWWD